MNAMPVYDALTALQLVLSAPVQTLPNALWMKCMHAEVGLRQALKEAGLQVPVEVEAQS